MSATPTQSRARIRLDQLLVARGLFDSRSRAADAVRRGSVRVAGHVCRKTGELVADDIELAVEDQAQSYVSRAAAKLIAGLDHFGFEPAGRAALDIGASTGGFTQVLIERGAREVLAVDVGHGQLHASLAADPRVINVEGLNARTLSRDHLCGRRVEAVVSDVSFISLKLALPPALELAEPGAFCMLLIKPQFEAGREAIGKGGLLKDPAIGEQVARDLAAWLGSLPGWKALGTLPSPIAGGDGNREFLLGGIKA